MAAESREKSVQWADRLRWLGVSLDRKSRQGQEAEPLEVEFLYLEGCPGEEPAWQVLWQAVRNCGVPVTVRRRAVRDQLAAEELRFLGSPTIRVNGLDVEREARQITQYSYRCRLYRNHGDLQGYPALEMVEAALREALARGTNQLL